MQNLKTNVTLNTAFRMFKVFPIKSFILALERTSETGEGAHPSFTNEEADAHSPVPMLTVLSLKVFPFDCGDSVTSKAAGTCHSLEVTPFPARVKQKRASPA